MARTNTSAVKKRRVIQKEIYVTDIFVSVVVVPRPDLIDKVDIPVYIQELSDILYRHYSNYEIIIVDNMLPVEVFGSTTKLLSELPCLRIIRLSRRYSHDMATLAGLESSIGDYTVVTDPALDPIRAIPRIVELNQETDIIQGTAVPPKGDKSIRMTIPRRIFYQYSRKYMSIDVPTNATYFMSLNRRAVAAVTSSAHKSVHIRFEVRMIGYKYQTMTYEVYASPIRNRSLRVGVFEATDIISSYSVHPLRLMSWIGLIASLVSIIYAIYVVIVAATHQVVEGWTTMSLQISGLFFILFLILVVLAEYIGKLLVESRHQPKYYVVDELVSTVALADSGRKNISKE